MENAVEKHMDQVQDVQPSSPGCEDCLKTGDEWVFLRMCMVCGHVGCCNASKNKHALGHFMATQHPIIQSYEPEQDWWHCYIDEVNFEVPEGPSFSHP